MSEEVDKVEEIEEPVKNSQKIKKVLTEKQIEALKKGRERQQQKKQERLELEKREKIAKDNLLNKKIQKIKTMEKALNKKHPLLSSSDSDSSDDYVPPPKKKTSKKTSSETPADVLKIEQLKLQQDILNKTHQRLYNSLFPNHAYF